MVAEIISVGTEILLGNIVNTNAAYIAEKCAYIGISNYYQVTVGDNADRLRESIELAKSRSDIIFLTGGLGPTEDDLTKETCAKVFNKELILDETAKQNIIDIFEKRGLRLTDNNWKQAMVPKDSIIMYNDNGTAPGIIMEDNGKIAVLLPGPPHEMMPMFEKDVIPYFVSKETDVIYSRMVKMVGVSESNIDEDIKDLIEMKNPTVATYAKTGEVHIRVTAKAENEETAKALAKPVVKQIKEKYEKNVYSTNAEETLEEAVVLQLSKSNYTITTAESCTGGLISATIVNVAGSSEVFKQGYVTYSNKAKKNILDVKKSSLEKYGAVSEQVAKEMAKGALKAAKADVSVAVTGIAGPGGGSPDKPVGLVYIAVAIGNEVKVNKFNFNGNRNKIRRLTVTNALAMVRMCVSEYNNSKKI